MGVLGKPGRLAVPPKLRVEKVAVSQKPKVQPSGSSAAAPNGKRLAVSAPRPLPKPRPSSRPGSASPYPSSDERRAHLKRKAVAAATPRDSPDFGDPDDDENDDEDPFLNEQKRRKHRHVPLDVNRRLRHKKAFGDSTREPRVIHAADIASLATECVPILGAQPDEVAVELQYPSRCRPERYDLVWKKDGIDVIKDILGVVKHVGETYLTETDARPFINHQISYLRQLERSSNENIQDLATFKAALKDYNEKLLGLIDNGSVAKNLDSIHRLPPVLVSFILDQVYDRTVAPKAEILNKYKTGSDNVYGELRHPFIHKILVEHGQMTSDQVFIDLGSGVGNVVLQAALEIGCKSYGCEMVETSCDFAEAQEKEFNARCLLWGVAPGRAQLYRGDFTKNEKTLSVLKNADLVLVNNKAFTEELNKKLVNMFLDLKAGCKIISLKPFGYGNQGAVNDIANSIFDVEEHTYPEDWVSWAASRGEYYVSVKRP